MIDYRAEIVKALSETGLTVYLENFLTSQTKMPCISYLESNNNVNKEANTLGYSNIEYLIKVWTRDVDEMANYSCQIADIMRKLGFKRVSVNELWLDGIGQNRMKFTAIGKEYFN